MFVAGLKTFCKYGLKVQTEDLSTDISLPTGQEGPCQEMDRGYLSGWDRAMSSWLMAHG